jgi:hypothetical protein
MSDDEKRANKFSDQMVLMCKSELERGTTGQSIVVGACLGLLGILAGTDEFPDLTSALRATIGQITPRAKPTFYDAPEVQ